MAFDLVEAGVIVGGGFLSGNIFDAISGFLRDLGIEGEDELKLAGVVLFLLAAYLASEYLGGRTGDLLAKFFVGAAAGVAGDDPPMPVDFGPGVMGVIR